ncbi:Sulfite oxidase [Fusarium oxysporum f. sp. albedinis]|nr:Sulfite oxidase [Fusarium oxysporum f. sp. albedinis]
MEKPLLKNDAKITSPRPRVITNARTLGRLSETEFVSSIRRSAESAAMDDLTRAVSQQATVTGTPRGKESRIASNPLTSWHWRLTDDGKTPLQIAAEQNKEEIVEFLLKTTPETMSDARVALGLAAAAGHLGVVKLLAVPGLSYEPKPADSEVIQTHDALEMAAKSGKSDVVQYLLQKGFEPRKQSIKKSALHLAAENGHVRVVRLLIDAGFDPNSTIKRPPVHCHYSNRRVSLDGLEDDLELTPAALAARNGHGDVLQLLHSHGASMDIPSGRSGYRPIHEAAAEGKVEAVRCLLEIGVSVTVRAGRFCDSHTPLDLAADGNHVEVARLLIQGSKPEAVQSAVQAAVQQGSNEVLDFLLEYGADANTKDTIGKSMLHIAAARNSPDAHKTIAVLLKHGADITATDGDGCWSELPIHKSIEAQNLASFETLLSAGADIHAELPDGRTCLYLAARVGAVDIGRRLLDEGLDPNHRAPGHIAYSGKDSTPLKAGLESFEGPSSGFTRLLLSRGAVVRDLDLLRCILACRPRWHQNEASKCALLLFPYFQPLLCQVEMVTTPAGTYGGATWAQELGDFVVSAFKGSPCEVETALEILTQVMVLSPPSVDCRVVRALLLHASQMKLMTLVDSVMQRLPRETCLAVAAGFRREASPKDPNLAFYVVQRYASLEEEEGNDDSMHNDEWRGE